MRNKIKQLMNKEEGFTLVELLAVIVILGLIVALAIPAIGNVIERAETNTASAESALIIDAARLYEVEKGPLDIGENVTVATLISEGYLETRDGVAPTGNVSRNSDNQLTYNE